VIRALAPWSCRPELFTPEGNREKKKKRKKEKKKKRKKKKRKKEKKKKRNREIENKERSGATCTSYFLRSLKAATGH
jgi:hypothetical protein